MKCKLCRGPCFKLGQMGPMSWYRCRNCGMDQSRRVKS